MSEKKPKSKMLKAIGGVLRLALGIGILVYLVSQIDKKVHGIAFATDSEITSDYNGTFTNLADASHAFILSGSFKESKDFYAIQIQGDVGNIASAGTLASVTAESSPVVVTWNAYRVEKSGLGVVIDVCGTAMTNWPWLLFGAAIFILATGMITYRWQLILESQSVNVPYPRLLGVTFIGMFFNSFMLGATGGDLVKAYYAMGECKEKKAEVFTSVFIDRVLGLPALVALAAVVMLLRLDVFLSHPAMRAAMIFISVLAVAIIVFLVLVFGKNLFERWKLFRLLEEKTALGPMIRRVYESFYHCRTRPGLLVKALILSVVAQITVVVTGYMYGRALAIDASFIDYLSVLPTVMIAGAVPITPGGVGLREAIIVLMLAALGIPAVESLPLSILIYLTIVGWSLPGGIVFLFFRRKTPIPTDESDLP